MNLKELEKFGFEYNNEEESYWGENGEFEEESFFEWYEKSNGRKVVLKITFNREIQVFDYDEDVIDTLFDLIQAGLVEKVEEKEE